MSAFYLWRVFSLQVGDTSELKGVKAHYDYDYSFNLHSFLSYVIFDQQLKTVENYFQKILSPPPPPMKKSTPRFLLTPF